MAVARSRRPAYRGRRRAQGAQPLAPDAARVFPSAVVHGIGRALMKGAQIGIRDAQGQAVVARGGAGRDSWRRPRCAEPRAASWMARHRIVTAVCLLSQLSVCCPGAGWAVPLETEVAGGLLLPLAELQTETVDAPTLPEVYFLSTTSLGSGAGGYVAFAVAAPPPARPHRRRHRRCL